MINLSIIIPHYNSTKSLKKLIETIPNKSDVEIIVVDDHSSPIYIENLLEINNVYKREKNIKILGNDKFKKGAGSCRNKGLSEAKGRWILFADSDDFFTIGFYEHVEKYFYKDKDVIFFEPTSIEIDTGKKSDRHLPYVRLIDNYLNNRDIKSEIFLRYSFVVPWSKLIRKEFLIKHNITFDEVLASNDVMFSTKVGYFMESFEISKNVIYCVTRGKGSLTTTISKKIYHVRLSVFISYFKFLQSHLTKKEFSVLRLSGKGYLFLAKSFGMKELLSVCIELKRNKIPLFTLQTLDPVWVIKKTLSIVGNRRKRKRYIIKE